MPGDRTRSGAPRGGAGAELAAVVAAADLYLGQCAAFVDRASDEAYRADSRTIVGGTIGKHVRHTLDHFRAALAVTLDGSPIDYDRRERNVAMETDRAAAIEAIREIRADLAALARSSLASPVKVRVMLLADGTEAVLDSTMARELAFAAHHAVHHHAMIRAIGAEVGVRAEEFFGEAAATAHARCAAPAARTVPG